MRSIFLAGFLALAWYAWSRNRHIRSLLYLSLGLFLSLYLKSVRHWLHGMGSDSFSEAQNFDWDEAWFFLKTIPSVLEPLAWNQYLETLALAVVLAGLMIYAQYRTLGTAALRWLGRLGIIVPLVALAGGSYTHYQSNSALYEGVRNHFNMPPDKLQVHAQNPLPLNIVVYIGESTTMMDWSLYGYPRATTPKLAAFNRDNTGLLIFHNVLSTQVMTSPSLLQALSFGVDRNEAYLPIYEQHRISLIDVLKKLSVPTLLLSNQTAAGTASLASSVIFRYVDEQEYSRDNAIMGNRGNELAAVPDDAFFQGAMQKHDALNRASPSVVFLHSYAGHGGYWRNIPVSAHKQVDGMFRDAALADVFGKRLTDKRLMHNNAEGYDAAMKYIDSTLEGVLEQVRDTDRPTVLLYFSDHGESPYTNVGHDSSRFHHEMFRVPFLMYFNPAAQMLAPSLYKEFEEASHAGRTSLLGQVPATVLRLLGYRLEQDTYKYQGVGLDEPAALGPVVVRRLSDSIDYIRSHGQERESKAVANDATDPVTTIWLNRRGDGSTADRPLLCYGDANTWGKAVRASIAADCLALTMQPVAKADEKKNHDMDNGWLIRAVARLAVSRGLPLWLDGSGLSADEACRQASQLRQWAIREQPHDSEPDVAHWRLDVVPEKNMPESCSVLQAQHIDLQLGVPEAVMQQPQGVEDWLKSAVNVGWPARLSLPKPPDQDTLDRWADVADVQWAVRDVGVNDLPWTAMPKPELLSVRTDWDPNSR